MTDGDSEKRRQRLRELRQTREGDGAKSAANNQAPRFQRQAGGGLRALFEQSSDRNQGQPGRQGGGQRGRLLKRIMEQRGGSGGQRDQGRQGDGFPQLRKRLAQRRSENASTEGNSENGAELLAKAERLSQELDETLRKLDQLIGEETPKDTGRAGTTITVDPEE